MNVLVVKMKIFKKILLTVCFSVWLVQTVSPQNLPKVYFNHFYRVFDQATFKEILGSEFIKNEFAAVDTGLPNFAAPTAGSGNLYLRGKNTYLEILGENNRFQEPLGKGGIAFTVENTGELAKVFNVLNTLAPDVYGKNLVTRTFPDSAKTPWYEILYRKSDGKNPIDYWITEYRKEFFGKTDKNAGTSADVSRARYLSKQYDPQKLLADINRIAVALPSGLKTNFIEDLSRLGFSARKNTKREIIILRGAEIEVTIFEARAERQGILSVGMKLNRKVAKKRVFNFGAKSRLTMKEQTAFWTF